MALTFTIAGVDRTNKTFLPDGSQTASGRRLFGSRGTFSFQTYDLVGATGYRPVVGQSVLVADGATVLARGEIIDVAEDPLTELDTGVISTITCIDVNAIPEKNTYTVTYAAGTSLADILQDLVDNPLAPYSVTLSGAQAAGPPLAAELKLDGVTVLQILNQLQQLYGWIWRIDENLVLRMWAPGDIPASFNLGDLTGSVQDQVSWRQQRSSTFANRVFLDIGDDKVTEEYDDFVGDGVTTQFVARFPNSSDHGYIEVNGVHTPIGPGTGYTVSTVADPDYAPQSFLKITAAVAPGVGVTIRIPYAVQFPVRLMADDPSAAASPWVQFFYAKNEYNIAAGNALASALLTRCFATPKTVNIRHRAGTSYPGQTSTLLFAERQLTSTFLILESGWQILDGVVFYTVVCLEGTTLQNTWLDFTRDNAGGATGANVTAVISGAIVPVPGGGGGGGTGGGGTPGNLAAWATGTTLGDTALNYTGNRLINIGAAPSYELYETDQALNAKRWGIVARGAVLNVEKDTDAGGSPTVLLSLTRAGVLTTYGQLHVYQPAGGDNNIFLIESQNPMLRMLSNYATPAETRMYHDAVANLDITSNAVNLGNGFGEYAVNFGRNGGTARMEFKVQSASTAGGSRSNQFLIHSGGVEITPATVTLLDANATINFGSDFDLKRIGSNILGMADGGNGTDFRVYHSSDFLRMTIDASNAQVTTTLGNMYLGNAAVPWLARSDGSLVPAGAYDVGSTGNPVAKVVADNNVGTSNFVANTTGWRVTGAGALDVRSAYVGGTLTVNSTITTPSATNLTLSPTGDVILGPSGADVLPNIGYTVNLGALTNKYLTLHAAELWVETLVAQNTIATIGGRVLVAPTTPLIADVGTGDTTIDVKYNQMASGDRVYMEADGKVEFMAITSGPSSITGGYRYSVTRNLDGSGANAWFAGDAILNTGITGSGFIDLYSISGVVSGAIGPTIVGNVRTGTTYNNIAARWAIGNLNGLYGYGATTFGAAFGDPSGTNVTVDATNGFRIRSGTTNKFLADTSGNLSIVGDLTIGTAGVLRSGATAYGTGTGYWLDYNGGTPRFRVGTTAGNRLAWDGTNLDFVSQYLTIDSTGPRLTPETSFVFTGARAYAFSSGSATAFGLAGYESGSNRALMLHAVSPSGTDIVEVLAQSTSSQPARVKLTDAGSGATTVEITAQQEVFFDWWRFTTSDKKFRVRGATADYIVLDGTNGNGAFVGSVSVGSAGLTSTNSTMNIDRAVAIAGDVRQSTGSYLYPGSASGLSNYQTSYYLASHATWGLHTNTNIHADGAFYAGSTFAFGADTDTYISNPSADKMEFYTGGVAAVTIDSNHDFFPSSDNARHNGVPSFRWVDVYAVNGTIQTSDIRQKTDVRRTPLAGAFLMALEPTAWRWDRSEDPREHHGFTAQGVAAALVRLGHDPRAFGHLHFDDYEMPIGLNYTGFIAPLVAGFQDHEARIAVLERRAAA